MASLNPFQFKPETQPAEATASPSTKTPEPPKGPRAWQPFTPRGVAAFAAAPSGYLFFIQVLMALLGAGCITWFLWTGWFPVIREGIWHLPTEGVIENYTLKAPIDPAEPLSSNRLLGITGDPEDQGSTGITTDLLVQLKKTKVRFCSLLGCTDVPYISFANSSYILFNRTELEPQWDAWEPILLTIAAAGSFLSLLLSWFILATLYFLPVWLFGWRKKKALTVSGSWRLASAALMPGALLLSAAIVCYRLGVIDLVSLFTLSLLHFVVSWVYLVTSTLSLPIKQPKTATENPFSDEPAPVEPAALPVNGADAASSTLPTPAPALAPKDSPAATVEPPQAPGSDASPGAAQKIPDENPS